MQRNCSMKNKATIVSITPFFSLLSNYITSSWTGHFNIMYPVYQYNKINRLISCPKLHIPIDIPRILIMHHNNIFKFICIISGQSIQQFSHLLTIHWTVKIWTNFTGSREIVVPNTSPVLTKRRQKCTIGTIYPALITAENKKWSRI